MLTSPVIARVKSQKIRKYPIFIEAGLVYKVKTWIPLATLKSTKKILILTDNHVKQLHLDPLVTELKDIGYEVVVISLIPGDVSKTFDNLGYILNQMLEHKFDRSSLCIAFGGGVIGDMAGLVSSLFMRGIRYIQIPTTTLSMIDSSVGGKTAINSPYGKNMIGTFKQPNLVIMDIELLCSLPQDQFIYGLVEAIKIFLTSDAKYSEYLEQNLEQILARNSKYLVPIIKRAVKLKANIVYQDESEENLRMILNCGHTVGHALEQLSNYQIPHGRAVALGIMLEAKIALNLKLLSKIAYLKIINIFRRLQICLDEIAMLDLNAVIKLMQLDKKNQDGKIHFILLKNIGEINLMQSGKVAFAVEVEKIRELINNDI